MRWKHLFFFGEYVEWGIKKSVFLYWFKKCTVHFLLSKKGTQNIFLSKNRLSWDFLAKNFSVCAFLLRSTLHFFAVFHYLFYLIYRCDVLYEIQAADARANRNRAKDCSAFTNKRNPSNPILYPSSRLPMCTYGKEGTEINFLVTPDQRIVLPLSCEIYIPMPWTDFYSDLTHREKWPDWRLWCFLFFFLEGPKLKKITCTIELML